MKAWEHAFRLHRGSGPEWKSYVRMCSDYYKRQILIYQNWPQRRFDGRGYSRGKVFRDMNA